MASGAVHFCWPCSRCGKIHKQQGRVWISRALISEVLSPEQIAQLPVLPSDYTVHCVRCGNTGAEWHHWAPKEIFGHDESDLWPGDYLCPKHHAEWHAQINKARTHARPA